MTVERLITEKIEFRLAQIRKWNPKVNAIVSLRGEDEILEEAYFKDKLPLEDRGILHGEIIAIKDLANAKVLEPHKAHQFLPKTSLRKIDLVVAESRSAGQGALSRFPSGSARSSRSWA